MKTDTLPTYLPVISVHGAVIFCDTILPLPVNEEQCNFLMKVADKNDGVIGVVQPLAINKNMPLPLYSSGTAAEIVNVTEHDEGGVYIAELKGLCRFVIEEELNDHGSSRYIRVSYNKYIFADSIAQNIEKFDKDVFVSIAKNYMQQNGISPNWSDLIQIPDIDLVNFLAMMGPFSPCEKQAVLEAISPTDQYTLLQNIMRMSLVSGTSSSPLIH
ncbi:MAG: hypothetical protein CNLJKLNK_00736 [Holosporales bacterium]